MNTNVGKISLDMVLNSREFDKNLTSKMNNIQKTTTKDLNKIEKTVSGPLTSAFSKLGVAVAAAFSVKAIVNFSSECLKFGSDLVEVQNVVDTAFKTMSGTVDEFAKTSIDRIGMSETKYKEYIGTMGLMSQSFGFTEKQALSMSKALTDLVGDVSSIRNISFEESYNKIKAVFTGETEALKTLGVVMTQNALDQFALQNGYGKTTAQMTEQEKVALRYKFVMEQLSYAQGDFQKTQGSWANQTRMLTENFNALKATIGQGLIQALTPVIQTINSLLKKLNELAKNFFNVLNISQESSDTSSQIGNIGEEALSTGEAVEGIGDAAVDASKKIQKSVMGFDELNKLTGLDSSEGGLMDSILGDMDIDEAVEPIKAQEKEESKLAQILDQVRQRAEALTKEFQNGLKLGLDATNAEKNLESVKNNLDRIKEASLNIFDEDVQKAADNYADHAANALGKIIGSAAGVGIALVDGLTGGTAQFLENQGPTIHDKLIKIFDINAETTDNIGNLATNIGEIFATTFSSDEFKGNVEQIETLFSTVALDSSLIMSKYCRDITGAINQVVEDNKKNIEEEQLDILSFTESMLGSFNTIVSTIGDELNETYDEKIGPFIQHMGEGFSDTAQKWHDGWTEYVTPALNEAKGKFDDFTNNTLKPMLEDVLGPDGSFGKFITVLQDFYDNVLKPVIDYCAKEVTKVIGDMIKIGEQFLEDILVAITDQINGILKVATGLIEFITGVFTGDWEKAWNGIKDTTEGVLNYIDGLIEGIIAKAKGIGESIKTAIEAGSGRANMEYANPEGEGIDKYVINNKNADKGALFRNYDYVGMIGDLFTGGEYTKKTREKQKSVPALATGGYIGPGQPTLALIGDNRSQGEIVSPVDKMAEVFENVLARTGSGQPQQIVLNNYTTLDGRVIYSETKNLSFNEANRQGSRQYR